MKQSESKLTTIEFRGAFIDKALGGHNPDMKKEHTTF